jgi:hypothetical protein
MPYLDMDPMPDKIPLWIWGRSVAIDVVRVIGWPVAARHVDLTGYGTKIRVGPRDLTKDANTTVYWPVEILTGWKIPSSLFEMHDPCARILGFNTDPSKPAEFAINLAKSVSERMAALDTTQSNHNTQAVVMASDETAQLLSVGMVPGRKASGQPSVPRWSSEQLYNRLDLFSKSASAYADRLKTGLQPDLAADILSKILSEMGDSMSSKSDMNTFIIEQTMQDMTHYRATLVSLAVEEAGYVSQFSDAQEKFKEGVKIKKGMDIATKVVDFAASTAEVFYINRERKETLKDWQDTPESRGFEEQNHCMRQKTKHKARVEHMSVALDALKWVKDTTTMSLNLEDLSAAIISLEKAELPKACPDTSADLTIFINNVKSGKIDPEMYSDQTRAQLLNVSNYDRSHLDESIVTYEKLAADMHSILDPAAASGVRGANELDALITKMAITAKASASAMTGLFAAEAVFAQQMYGIIQDSRNAEYLKKSARDLQRDQLQKVPNFVQAVWPGFKSISDTLWQLLMNICTAYFYAEGVPCGALDQITRNAYSIDNFKTYIGSVQKVVDKLKKSSPQTRQAFNAFAVPIEIDASNMLDNATLEAFKKDRQMIISSKRFYEHGVLSRLKVVCMQESAVELVGVQPGPNKQLKVEVYMASLGANVLQKTQTGQELLFKTPAIELMSSYKIGVARDGDDAPEWIATGAMKDQKNYFCRSPFQDMMIRVLPDADLDLSKLTAIKVYVRGYGIPPDKLKSRDGLEIYDPFDMYIPPNQPWQDVQRYDWTKDIKSSSVSHAPWV